MFAPFWILGFIRLTPLTFSESLEDGHLGDTSAKSSDLRERFLFNISQPEDFFIRESAFQLFALPEIPFCFGYAQECRMATIKEKSGFDSRRLHQ